MRPRIAQPGYTESNVKRVEDDRVFGVLSSSRKENRPCDAISPPNPNVLYYSRLPRGRAIVLFFSTSFPQSRIIAGGGRAFECILLHHFCIYLMSIEREFFALSLDRRRRRKKREGVEKKYVEVEEATHMQAHTHALPPRTDASSLSNIFPVLSRGICAYKLFVVFASKTIRKTEHKHFLPSIKMESENQTNDINKNVSIDFECKYFKSELPSPTTSIHKIEY
uniref:Uncharacterized protein n=1 Tax=Trichogramma kaykai TaxID=54128 RepID=A0ABD2WL41_9HYME